MGSVVLERPAALGRVARAARKGRAMTAERGVEHDSDREVLTRLARIETKLDVAIGRVDDHETRIRRLERAVWVAAGAAATGGGIVGAIIRQAIGG